MIFGMNIQAKIKRKSKIVLYGHRFITHIKAKDFYKDIKDDVEEKFDTSNYESNRLLPIGKNKKVIGPMIDELGGNIMTEFVALRAKTYSYLRDDDREVRKDKGTKK